jgi:hypothetical protein
MTDVTNKSTPDDDDGSDPVEAESDGVEEADQESFPASDPPSTWSGEDPNSN